MSIGAISGGMSDFSGIQGRMQDMMAQQFAAADADGSGGVSLEEFEGMRANGPSGSANPAGAPSAEEAFARLDADGNGEVTSAEFEPAKPPSPAGNFSPDMLASLLQTQEVSGQTTTLDSLSAAVETEASTEDDLVDGLLDLLSGSEEESEDA